MAFERIKSKARLIETEETWQMITGWEYIMNFMQTNLTI